jgi:hypothetical protein
MMDAESISETSVRLYQTTWHNIPEDISSSSITLMMEAETTAETSVSFYQITRLIIPVERELHTQSENMKSDLSVCIILAGNKRKNTIELIE